MYDRNLALELALEDTPELLEFYQELKASHEVHTLAQLQSPAAPENYKTKLRTPDDISKSDVLSNRYIIKGWLDKGADATLFGDWNAGKTFVVLDMAASIALGKPWFGMRVRKSRVLYLGYEGHAGLKRRIKALSDKYPGLDAAPFAWWPMVAPLTTPEGKDELKRARRDYAGRFVQMPDLIIVDTLRKALGGSDSDADLVERLGAETRALMTASECTVLKVHHSGHANKDRARGDSGIVAGVDSEIMVEAGENGLPGVIKTTKERDVGKGEVYFRLQVVELGRDDDGDAVTTCVVEPATAMDRNQMTETAAEQVLGYLRQGEREGAEKGYFTLRDLQRNERTALGLSHGAIAGAVELLKARGHVVDAPLPADRKQGSRTHYLKPVDVFS